MSEDHAVDDPDLDPAHNPALAALTESGISFRAARHEPVSSLAEAAAARGIEPGDIVKSMVVRYGDPRADPGDGSIGGHLIVLVPGGRKISWKKLRHALGVNKAAMPSAEEALAITGFARGTITPFGTRQPLPVIADQQVPGREISMGGGAHHVAVYLSADAMIEHFAARVLDITDPE